MSEILKGNFRAKNEPTLEEKLEKEPTLEEVFKAAAYKKLGGSVTFVKGKGRGSFLWKGGKETVKTVPGVPKTEKCNTLAEKITQHLAEATDIKTGKIGRENAVKNAPYYRKTISDLMVARKAVNAAIVLTGGPSLHRKNPAEIIIKSGFSGDIVATDGSLGYCLRNSLVPDYVLCLDPHPYRIVRWFGDPDLTVRPEDDYYRRQDLDPEYWNNETRWNNELIGLVNHHGKNIKAILSTSVDPTVTKRCVESGMDIYWWSPLYDDHAKPESVSMSMWERYKIPCMVTGGNVGTAAWIFAQAVLERKDVALAGMDFGYAPGTPYFRTQYWYELQEILGEKAEEAFTKIPNPHINETWFCDPTYLWFKQIFLDLAGETNCTTYNCTEGGILFGEPIQFIPLKEFLSKFTLKES